MDPKIFAVMTFSCILSPHAFILLSIFKVRAKYELTIAPSFIFRTSKSLHKACNCALFTLVEPWNFCFIESQMFLDVSSLRIVSKISRSTV
ncbi:hypothetical protein Fmac_032656 [Flemingia macrophylla]|uniref:Uncharacterized protein n=1 Tax=Flemingia macrophylla TaxID=520843 RepID=A0ABD1L5I4_9FABA